jgi:transitional endoplasmic reticulum ATPase
LAATNLPDAIDSAILSRLPEKLEIPLPGLAEREKLFSLFLSKIKNIDLDMVTVVRSLAERYTGVSGRDIRNIVDTAQQSAVRRALSEGMPDRIAVTVGDLGISDAVRDPV